MDMPTELEKIKSFYKVSFLILCKRVFFTEDEKILKEITWMIDNYLIMDQIEMDIFGHEIPEDDAKFLYYKALVRIVTESLHDVLNILYAKFKKMLLSLVPTFENMEAQFKETFLSPLREIYICYQKSLLEHYLQTSEEGSPWGNY
jgi:hypothetical protein